MKKIRNIFSDKQKGPVSDYNEIKMQQSTII